MVEKKLLRGSIRAVKHPKLYEPDKAKQIRIESNMVDKNECIPTKKW